MPGDFPVSNKSPLFTLILFYLSLKFNMQYSIKNKLAPLTPLPLSFCSLTHMHCMNFCDFPCYSPQNPQQAIKQKKHTNVFIR